MLRKILAWKYGIVIALIFLATYGTARKYEETREQYEQKCSQLNAGMVPPAAHSEDCDKGAEKATRNLPLRYHIFAWPEGITVRAILLTLFAIAEQTSATRDAANAAYGSVTFAKAQWEATIAQQKARLDLSVEQNALTVAVSADQLLHLTSTIWVRNTGESKAFIGVFRGALVSRLRNTPLEDIGNAMLDLPDRVIEPNNSPIESTAYFFPDSITAPTFAECLEQGTFNLHFFGFIEYETIGLWWRKEFGYDWVVLERGGALGNLYGISDPYPKSPMPARDRIAYGYWRANEERNKPEYPIARPSET